MKKSSLYLILTTWLLLANFTWADDFCQSSKFTQVVGDVAHGKQGVWNQQANLDDVLTVGEELKTGVNSRAELTSADSTVIRVGANSIFSFSEQTRQVFLQQGNILFHTPHGNGGGIIKTASITAAVTGSTVAISATSDGAVKVVPLESACTIKDINGRTLTQLHPGQMLAMLPGGSPIVVPINLQVFTKSSGLIGSFQKPLQPAVQSKIDHNVAQQANHVVTQAPLEAVAQTMINKVALPTPVRPPEQVLQAQAPPVTETININGVVYTANSTQLSGHLILSNLKLAPQSGLINSGFRTIIGDFNVSSTLLTAQRISISPSSQVGVLGVTVNTGSYR